MAINDFYGWNHLTCQHFHEIDCNRYSFPVYSTNHTNCAILLYNNNLEMRRVFRLLLSTFVLQQRKHLNNMFLYIIRLWVSKNIWAKGLKLSVSPSVSGDFSFSMSEETVVSITLKFKVWCGVGIPWIMRLHTKSFNGRGWNWMRVKIDCDTFWVYRMILKYFG